MKPVYEIGKFASWISPPEQGIDNKSTLTLPNGEKIPTARIAVNNLLRRTPEMNFMLRSNQNFGRNAHYRNQSNEDDYSQGENRFIRSALGESVHNHNDLLDYPIADYILSEINEKYAVDDKEPLQVLPSLELHKRRYKTNPLNSESNKSTYCKKTDTRRVNSVTATCKDY